MNKKFIKLNNFSKSYFTIKNGKQTVFDNQSFSVKSGKNIGIIGLNGSGKSTLLRLLGKIESPTSGSIETSGTISWPIGLYSGIDLELTGKENVIFICMLLGIKDSKEVIKEVFERADIKSSINKQVKYYSAGMRMKFTFYLCLIFDFDFFLVDEVTSVGDSKFKEASQNYMKQRTSNSTLILTSHSESNIKENCDLGCIVHKKKISRLMEVDEAISIYNKLIIDESSDLESSKIFMHPEYIKSKEQKDIFDVKIDESIINTKTDKNNNLNYLRSKYER